MKRICLFAPIALGAAIFAVPAAAQDYSNLGASLFGTYVVGNGDGDASADFNGEIDHRRGRVCYYLELVDLDDATGIAIHRAEERSDGPEVMSLTLPGENGDEICITGDGPLLTALREKPDDYYLLIRSESHPEGAVRGQLHD
jgi:CHRD domain